MQVTEEYELSQYQDLGPLNDKRDFRLKRHKVYGRICVEKRVSAEQEPIYHFLQAIKCVNVPKIYECIRDGSELLIMEEYVPGRNLEEFLQERCFNPAETAYVIMEIIKALKILHNLSPMIVCRDLKAENIMLTEDNAIRIVDFNIARMTVPNKEQDTRLLGTIGYAAPEQYGFSQTDNRTDIYALGVLMNYMMLKKYPSEQLAYGPLRRIIEKCIQIDPRRRFQTVEELETAIEFHFPDLSPNYTKERKLPHWFRWLPPGFRTFKPWKMIIGTIGYILITVSAFRETRDDISSVPFTGEPLLISRICYWISYLALVAIVFNYGGIRTMMPVIKKKVNVFTVALYWFFAYLAGCLAIGVIEVIYYP